MLIIMFKKNNNSGPLRYIITIKLSIHINGLAMRYSNIVLIISHRFQIGKLWRSTYESTKTLKQNSAITTSSSFRFRSLRTWKSTGFYTNGHALKSLKHKIANIYYLYCSSCGERQYYVIISISWSKDMKSTYPIWIYPGR